MTREEAIKIFRKEIECLSHTKCEDCILEKACDPMNTTPYDSEYIEAYSMAIKALEQEPCEDAISRQEVLYLIADDDLSMGQVVRGIHALPSVTPQEPNHGKCNQCKHYEGVHNVQGHAPCSYHKIGGVVWNWYCSQFESEVKE